MTSVDAPSRINHLTMHPDSGLFFLAMAALNEVIWRNFSTDFWVSFKLIGFMPITMAFAILQIRGMKRFHLKEAPAE